MLRYIQLLLIIFFSSFISLSASDNDGSRYSPNSVLSEGTWYKIQTPTTGVYKLTYDDLKKMGLSNPQNVQVYGYGGWILDEAFSKPYVDDLPKVSLWMSKDPASFGKGDYILFYARGDIKWVYDETLQEFVQTQNPYSFDNYYFVTESTNGPLLMDKQNSLSSNSLNTTTFDDYYLHEEELVNVGKSGRVFYGEDFGVQKNRDFKLPLEGITNDPARIHYDFISKAPLSSGRLEVSVNGTLDKTNYTSVTNDSYVAATDINDVIVKTGLKDDNTLNMNYTRGSTMDYNTYLNYIRVTYRRQLKPYGAVTLFRRATIADNLGFSISDANSSFLVFDVTGNNVVKQIDTQLSGSTLSFAASNNEIKEYALVDLSKTIPTPEVIGKVTNQNLHASKVADMVIIVQPFLQKYAEQLAKLHSDDSGLTTLIVNPDDIYNEYSSGKPDVTAYRRFMKMFYDRATTDEEKPKYLLIFGGGTYDNRFIAKRWTESDKKTMTLTYQSEMSLIETASYVTDDYMGFLNDNEGDDLAYAKLNLGIGRLPVRTEQETIDVVAKIEKYIKNENVGIWENNVTFVADDAIAGTNSPQVEKGHMSQSEALANIVSNNYPDFIVDKIYEDAYERVVDGTAVSYPDATEALLDRINKGSLLINYVGHGSTRAWSHENLLTQAEIGKMTNDKLGLWVTATCDFSRFDADATSGGETALFNANGGAIGLFSTVRVVYMSNNKVINQNIINNVFDKEDNSPARLGDILRKAKTEQNLSTDLNKLKFLLLGDPALRLSYPKDTYKVEVTEVNELEADASTINIQALGNTVIKGQILNQDGDVATEFNGTLESVIFDAIQTLTTKGNTTSGTNENIAQDYTDYTNQIFAGKTEIKDGLFEIRFVTSKDILNKKGHGKMSFLAYDVSKENQAQGSFENYTVGGVDPNVQPETNPPVISKLYLDNENFVSGDIVTSTPLFYAEVSDDTGINLSTGMGHNMVLILDEDEQFDLTPYFASEDDYNKKGKIQYRMPFLSPGKHSLEFKVWDVWDNLASEIVQFTVVDDAKHSFDSFQIWGNPATDMTRFVFEADKPAVDINIKIYVYSLTGALVWMHESQGAADSLNQYIYEWNLTTGTRGRLIPGIYVCTAHITIDGKTTKKSLKLIIKNNN